jgi:type I restriction enzyme M protein
MISQGEKEASDILASLYSAFDKVRGPLSTVELIEPLVMLAVVKKLAPDRFEEIFRCPLVSQKQYLFDVVEQLKSLGHFDFGSLRRDAFNPEILQTFLYFVSSVESMPHLADAVYDVYTSISARQGGEVLTSSTLSELLRRFAGDATQSIVFDGAAGLCSVVSNVDSGHILLKDISESAKNIGQGLLTLKDKEYEYTLGNSLLESKHNANADLVIMQPPWGMRINPDHLAKISRQEFMVVGKDAKVPSSASDAIWIQFALFNANEDGRVVLILPHGWTFRGGYDAKLRKYLLDNDLVESITALPAGIHDFTNIPSLVLVLNKNKAKDKRGIVNFVDASNLGIKKGSRAHFSENELDLIASLMKGDDEHVLSKQVLLPEIYQNDYRLNIKEYFVEVLDIDLPDYKEEKANLAAAQKVAEEKHNQLMIVLSQLT